MSKRTMVCQCGCYTFTEVRDELIGQQQTVRLVHEDGNLRVDDWLDAWEWADDSTTVHVDGYRCTSCGQWYKVSGEKGVELEGGRYTDAAHAIGTAVVAKYRAELEAGERGEDAEINGGDLVEVVTAAWRDTL